MDEADDRIDGQMPMVKISETMPSSDTAQPIEEIGDVVPLETAVRYSSHVCDASPFCASSMHPFDALTIHSKL